MKFLEISTAWNKWQGRRPLVSYCIISFSHHLCPSVLRRALNEMWKCQNLLRNNVKDLLDLVKKPKVTLTEAHFQTLMVHSASSLLSDLMFSLSVRSLTHRARPYFPKSWWSQVRDFTIVKWVHLVLNTDWGCFRLASLKYWNKEQHF